MPSIKETLGERGLSPKKSFGQNFMVDQRVNTVFADAVRSLKAETIVEIGAGTGSLTKHLVEIATVHAVERDRDLVPILREQFAESISINKLILHEADGARFDLLSVLNEQGPGVLVGNLPYHLTSSIVLMALKQWKILKGAVFLVQKEVADRLASPPNSKDYGFLTAILHLAFRVERVMVVDRSAFWPQPRIDSAIIKLTKVDAGISQVDDIEALVVFVRGIFQKRRKKLSTILAGQISKDSLISIGIDPDARPETLAPKEFLRLYLSSIASN